MYREPNTMCPECGLPLRKVSADSTLCANAHGFDGTGHPPEVKKAPRKKAAKKKA